MDPVSSSQHSFTGEFRHQLDEKNRITIPSDWRRARGTAPLLFVPESRLNCLLVMAPQEFDRLISHSAMVEGASAIQIRKFQRQMHARAKRGAPDKQGRLVLPDEHCKQLELKGEVALVGGAGRFEIWNVARWESAFQDEQASFEHVANLVGL